MRLLIVDDTAVVRAALARMASERGWQVDAVASRKAARAVDLAGISGAILDLELGADSGVDVARDLLAARPELPIVFLSATRDPELLARARAIAPVLDKLDGLGRIEAWAAALTRDAP